MPSLDLPTLITLAISLLLALTFSILLHRKRILHPRAFDSPSKQRDVLNIPASVWFVCAAMIYLAQGLFANLARSLPPSILGDAASLRAKVIPEGLAYAGALAIGVLMIFLVLPRTTDKTGLRLRPSDLPSGLLALLLAAPFFLLTSIAAQHLSTLFGHPPPKIAHETLTAILDSRDDPWCWVRVGVVVLLVPAVEELIYRVFLGSCLLALFKTTWPAILITSTLFTLVHTTAVPPAALPGLFVLGLALGLAYEHTRSLGVPIVMHALFNAANIALAFLQ